jgi:hypothetical protein
MDDLSDRDLVEAAKAGDTSSFGELVRRTVPDSWHWRARWSVPTPPRT